MPPPVEPRENPFFDGDQPPSDHAMTLFLGKRAGKIQEVLVSLLERHLEPAWVWLGPGFGWALQAHNFKTSLMTLQARERPMVATLAFPPEVLRELHQSANLSTRAKHLVPLTVANVPAAYVYVDLEAADGVDVLLELLDARIALLAHEIGERHWS